MVFLKKIEETYLKQMIILFLPGVPEALKEIKKQKIFDYYYYEPIKKVGRGILSEDNFKKFTNIFNKILINKTKINLIDDLFFCPHHPKKGKVNIK